MNRSYRPTNPASDGHVVLANLALRSQRGLTAFSALPDAPVLPTVERRPSNISRLRLLATGGIRQRNRRSELSSQPRRTAIAGAGPAC